MLNMRFQNMINNWNTNFVMDIRTDLSSCSLKDGYEPFTGMQWGGTMEGCDCTDGKGVRTRDLLSTECSQHEIDNGCTIVDATDPKYLTKYRGRTICMKRGDVDFLSAITPGINGECPDDTYKCADDSTPPSKIICAQNKTE